MRSMFMRRRDVCGGSWDMFMRDVRRYRRVDQITQDGWEYNGLRAAM